MEILSNYNPEKLNKEIMLKLDKASANEVLKLPQIKKACTAARIRSGNCPHYVIHIFSFTADAKMAYPLLGLMGLQRLFQALLLLDMQSAQLQLRL